MYVSLNELSGNIQLSQIETISEARQIMNNFVTFLKDLKINGLIQGIILNGDIHAYQLSKDYSVRDWFEDEKVDRVYKQFLRSYIGKNFSYFNKEDINGEYIFVIQEKEYFSDGCAFAIEYGNKVLSLCTNVLWEERILNGKYRGLNDEGELVEEEKKIDNLMQKMSLDIIKVQEKMSLYQNISSGYDLWEERERIFPNLIFCENVREQLYQDPEKFHILSIMKRLEYLQNYFAKCGGRYEPKTLGINPRTESESVKTDPDLRRYRLFRLPNGKEEYFFDHISFTGKYSGGRIYFYPVPRENKCYIGYIGRHLPTKKF